MPFEIRPTILDIELERWNDATAAAARDNNGFRMIDPNDLNALICEIQAWRREYPNKTFVSGPNNIIDKP